MKRGQADTHKNRTRKTQKLILVSASEPSAVYRVSLTFLQYCCPSNFCM